MDNKAKEIEESELATCSHTDTRKRGVGLSEKYLEETYSMQKVKSDNVIRSTGHYLKKNYMPNGNCMKSYFLKRLPIFGWLFNYDFKQNFVKDLIAGLTIGIVHIPQGLAYAMMAGVPAINGLYVSFFTVALYVFLGTSRHLSVGTYAIISLLVRSSIDKYKGILFAPGESSALLNLTMFNSSYDDSSQSEHTVHEVSHRMASEHGSAAIEPIGYLAEDPVQARIMLAMTLALFSGIIQVIFAICHVGYVTKYLSDAIVNGFTTGAAYHVVVSQIPTLLGIKLGEEHSPFVIIGELIQIAKHIVETKAATVIISIISIAFLYIIKHHINERFRDKMPAPVPVELIAVVIGTVVSYLAHFKEKYSVAIIGPLPLGMPSPKMPPLHIMSLIFSDAMTIAIVSFAINISMAKLFAKRHKYEIRANQEVFAYGLGNIIASFFDGFPACVGLSRCVILESVGGRTQAHGIFSCILVLIVVLFLGPLFRTLPNAILASIIVVALKTMILEVKTIVPLLKKSKIEALGWLVTFGGVMIFNIDVGLYIGLIVSLLLVIIKSQRARSSIMGIIPGSTIYECVDVCNEARELEGMRIIRYEESVYYANVDNFKYKVLKLSKINPEQIKESIQREVNDEMKTFVRIMKQEAKKAKKDDDNESAAPKVDVNQHKKRLTEKIRMRKLDEIPYKHIILDCSCMNFIDSQGVDTILKLHESFKELEVNLYLAHCKQAVIKSFKKNKLQDGFDFDRIFLSTHDAVLHVLSLIRPDLKLDENEKLETGSFGILIKQTNLEAKTDQEEYYAYNF